MGRIAREGSAGRRGPAHLQPGGLGAVPFLQLLQLPLEGLVSSAQALHLHHPGLQLPAALARLAAAGPDGLLAAGRPLVEAGAAGAVPVLGRLQVAGRQRLVLSAQLPQRSRQVGPRRRGPGGRGSGGAERGSELGQLLGVGAPQLRQLLPQPLVLLCHFILVCHSLRAANLTLHIGKMHRYAVDSLVAVIPKSPTFQQHFNHFR